MSKNIKIKTTEEDRIASYLKKEGFKEIKGEYLKENFKEPPMFRRLKVSVGNKGDLRIYDGDENKMILDEWKKNNKLIKRRIAEVEIKIIADQNKEGEEKIYQLFDSLKKLYKTQRNLFHAE